MQRFRRAVPSGSLLACVLVLASCSDSNDGNGTPAVPADDASATASDGVDPGAATNTSAADPDSQAASDAPARVENDAAPSGAADQSPTETESLSLVGPFVRDESRGAGPPSSPSDLTALLTAEDWVEFSWVPSADDQSVEAYEIYRDGTLLRTVTNSGTPETEYRYWLGTNYMDCNYTKNAECETQQPAIGSTHEYYVVAVDNEGQRSQPSDPAVFTLVTPQESSVDLADYELVFADEFDGDSLDVEKWKTSLPWGPDTTINGEMQYFVDIFASDPIDFSPFRFDGQSLAITGSPTPAELSAAVNGQPYLSGVITSSDKFAMTYGYVEMRARVASGSGLLSTFYLFNDDFERNKPEIDIVEYRGDRPDRAYQTYHYYDSNRAREFQGEKHSSPTMETIAGVDLSADFHTYGVLWEPGLIVWYIDGREVRRITGPRVSDEPMHIIAHLVVGSEWVGPPDVAVLPAELQIDYIRAYQ